MKTSDLLCRRNDLRKVADMMKNWDEKSLFQHSLAVADLSREIALVMGFSESEAEMMQIGGFLHDFGKISWPHYLVSKKELTEDDHRIVRDHPLYGVAYARECVKKIDADITKIICQHHEKPDGGGYPHGLKDEQISPYSRIVAAVECFVAMTERRAYRDQDYTPEQAIEIAIQECFDRETLSAIRSLCRRKVVAVG